MMTDIKEEEVKAAGLASIIGVCDFMTQYLEDLSQMTGQISVDGSQMMYQNVVDRKESLMTYKDKNHFSSRFDKTVQS